MAVQNQAPNSAPVPTTHKDYVTVVARHRRAHSAGGVSVAGRVTRENRLRDRRAASGKFEIRRSGDALYL